MKRLAHIEAAIAEAERLGYSLSVTMGKKHFKGIVTNGFASRSIFLSASPSDGRVIENCRKDVRKAVRQIQNGYS